MSAVEQILAIVESIPAGRVTTYGLIADAVEGATARAYEQEAQQVGDPAPGQGHRQGE